METVLITGGAGLIGRHLSVLLQKEGYNIALLSRKKTDTSPYPVFLWDPDTGIIDPSLRGNTDYLVHLAGAGIGDKRWNAARRRIIIDSRVKSAGLLHSVFSDDKRLKAFISASATGYYGAVTSDRIFSEDDLPSDDFLGQTCLKWEDAAGSFGAAGIRTVMIRTGVVLSGDGGALPRIARPVSLGFGSALGTGKQYMPWIHIDDLCRIYLKAIKDETMQGSYNAIAPVHITNQEFTKVLAEVLHKPLWFPKLPSFVLKALFGTMSDILLKGSRVSSDKIIKTGFQFTFPDPQSALKEIYS